MQLWLPFSVSFAYLFAAGLFYRVYRAKLSPFVALGVLVLACQGHAFALASALQVGEALNFSIFYVISIFSWSVSAVAVFALWRRTEALAGMLIALMSAVFVLLPLLAPVSKPFLRSDMSLGLLWHILSSIAAWTVLSIAVVHAGIYYFFFQRLKQKKRLVPHVLALTGLERMMMGLSAMGLVILSIALITGWWFVENLFAQHLLYKTVFTMLAWLVLVLWFVGWWQGRRGGMRTTTALMAAYGFLLLGYVVNNVFLQFVMK